MAQPAVYIRLDHGHIIGDGHLFRCKTLAEQFAKRDYSVTFVTRIREGLDLKKFTPFKVITLSNIGVATLSPLQDAQESLVKSGSSKGDIWILDHYGLSSEWEEIVKQNHIMISIDDLTRPHNADIAIDHNVTAKTSSYQARSLNPDCLYMMGPEFALLRESIQLATSYNPSANKRGILLYLGTCTLNVFDRVLHALQIHYAGPIDILNPPKGFQSNGEVRILSFTDEVHSLYHSYSRVVGACGVAHIERMALGVPTISCAVVENQKNVNTYFDEITPEIHLGFIETLSDQILSKKMQIALQCNENNVFEFTHKLAQLVAKDGPQKVVNQILKIQSQKF